MLASITFQRLSNNLCYLSCGYSLYSNNQIVSILTSCILSLHYFISDLLLNHYQISGRAKLINKLYWNHNSINELINWLNEADIFAWLNSLIKEDEVCKSAGSLLQLAGSRPPWHGRTARLTSRERDENNTIKWGSLFADGGTEG